MPEHKQEKAEKKEDSHAGEVGKNGGSGEMGSSQSIISIPPCSQPLLQQTKSRHFPSGILPGAGCDPKDPATGISNSVCLRRKSSELPNRAATASGPGSAPISESAPSSQLLVWGLNTKHTPTVVSGVNRRTLGLGGLC